MLRNADTATLLVHVRQIANCTILSVSASECGSVHLLV